MGVNPAWFHCRLGNDCGQPTVDMVGSTRTPCCGDYMPDLTPDGVKILADSLGLKIDEEDLTEVTHRLNVIVAGVERFSHPGLDSVDPVPFPRLEEAGDGQ